MSTSYYYLREQVDSLDLHEDPDGDDEVSIIMRNRPIPVTIRCHPGDGRGLCLLLSKREYDDAAPITTHYGGPSVGCVVVENIRDLDPFAILVSEYGEPRTIAQIRSFAGYGKCGTIAQIGELFGYPKPAQET